MKKINAAIVEDNLSDLELIKYELNKSNYQFDYFELDSYEDFFDVIKQNKIDIVMMEYNIFGKTALELLQQMKKKKINIPVIIVSSIIDDDKIMACLKYGAADYIAKEKLKKLPFVIKSVLVAEATRLEKIKLDQALEMMKLAIDQSGEIVVILNDRGRIIYFNRAFLNILGYKEKDVLSQSINKFVNPKDGQVLYRGNKVFIDKLNAQGVALKANGSVLYIKYALKKFIDNESVNYILQIFDLTQEIEYNQLLIEKERKVKETLLSTLKILGKLLEMNAPYKKGHQQAVANFSLKIASRLDLSSEAQQNLKYAALLHDIGKINMPVSLLVKPDRLTRAEMLILQQHPESGYEIIKDIAFANDIGQMVLQHHERINGSGYPYGLRSGEILFGSKIIAVADVAHAMLSRRPYRKPHSLAKTMDELKKNSGILYDAFVVEIAVNLMQEIAEAVFES